MPTNTQVTAAIVFTTPLPDDQNCPPETANDWLQLAADNLAVAAVDPESPASQTDSTAELALNAANNALAQVATLQGSIPERRTSGSNLIPLATGGSVFPLSWSPAMPNANYEVQLTFFSEDSAVEGPEWTVINASRTVTSCQIRMMLVPPAGGPWSFAYSITAL